jgi:hypothetical protein
MANCAERKCPALFVGRKRMIIWDEKDLWVPIRDKRCEMCCGRLQPPFVAWHPQFRGEDSEIENDEYLRFFCGECCTQMRRGFSADLRQMATAKEVRRLGFHHAARGAAVSGGFLYTTRTSNKQ